MTPFDTHFRVSRAAMLAITGLSDGVVRGWADRGLYKDRDRTHQRGFDLIETFSLRIAGSLAEMDFARGDIIALANDRLPYRAAIEDRPALRLVKQRGRLTPLPEGFEPDRPCIYVPLRWPFAETFDSFVRALTTEALSNHEAVRIGHALRTYQDGLMLKAGGLYAETLRCSTARATPAE